MPSDFSKKLSSKGVRAVIEEEARRAYPQEACGFVLAIGKKCVAVVARNIAQNPRNEFLVAHEDTERYAEQGEIVAVWHTHVNIPPNPSDADKAGCYATDVPWLIMSIYENEVGEFSTSDINLVEPELFSIKYEGRPYVFGTFDCWTLVRDYYKNEFGIALGDQPRIVDFWKKGYDQFGDTEIWKREGFVKLVDEKPIVGDCFLIGSDSTDKANHIAIYVGNDLILHHCQDRLSRTDVYFGYWEKHTMHHMRRAEFCNAG